MAFESNIFTGSSAKNLVPKFKISDCHGPFEVGFRTDSETADATSETVSNRGTCLEYIQLPCGAACGNP